MCWLVFSREWLESMEVWIARFCSLDDHLKLVRYTSLHKNDTADV